MDAVSPELVGVVGFHNVTKEQARELIQAFVPTDGFYLLRPSSDPHGSVLCTICVTNKHKLVNYRLVSDRASQSYHIYPHTKFSSIQQLLEHYRHIPINAEANTRLLYPITPAPEKQSLEGEDCYVIMERTAANGDQQQPQQPTVNSLPASLPPKQPRSEANSAQNSVDHNGVDSDIPGLHHYLPRQEINTVMQAYLSTNGSYLIRHSTTSAGQFTMAVSHGGKVLNFKINFQDGQYFISPRRRFDSVQELLLAYRTSPMKSKRCGNEKIFLSNPIPVDQALEKKFKQIMENKDIAQAEPLPEPWQEHFNEEYRRPYFYNTVTGVSVWNRPKCSEPQFQRAQTLPNKPAIQSPKISRKTRVQSRPLPAPPEDNTAQLGVPSQQRFSGSTSPLLGRKRDQPHPHLPPTEEVLNNTPPQLPPTDRRVDTPPQLPPTDGRVPASKRALPPLPPKDDEMDVLSRSLPPLPSKENSRRGSAPPQMPQRSSSVQEQRGRPIPPLPPKEPDAGAATSTVRGRPLPQLPPKERELPPLPPKDDRPLPPLPPKMPGQHEATPPTVPGPRPEAGQRERKRRAVVEYEDNMLLKQKEERRGIPSATREPVDGPPAHLQSKASLPPLPEKTPAPVVPPPPPVGQSIPAPPPPPVGTNIPAPPPPPVGKNISAPPPPKLPPPRSPTPSRENIGRQPPTNESSSEGRPFTANDLLAAKTLLKKTLTPENSPDLRRNTVGHTGGGLADVFASAIDTRMTSIRKAMVDSDSDGSEFEDVDDDEDWD